MSHYLLPGSPAEGTTLRLPGGQTFTCVGFEPYRRADGSETELSVWHSDCPACGGLVLAKTSRKSGGSLGRRRCDNCRSPGRASEPKAPKERKLTRAERSAANKAAWAARNKAPAT